MGLIKLASAYHGIAAAAKNIASMPTVRNAAIGAAGGAVIGAATAKSGDRLKHGLNGAVIGGAVGGGGTLLHQASQVQMPGSFGSKVKLMAGMNEANIRQTGNVYRAGRDAATHNLKDPKFQEHFMRYAMGDNK